MEFIKLKEEEFDDYASKHENSSFYQTINWGKLKQQNGWEMHLVGLKDNNKIIAASLLLSKNTPIKRKMFYAPRGFLIDYNNYDLLKEFTFKIKEYLKKNNGIFIKIDPYVFYQERDINGTVVDNGENNINGFNNLINLGYQHFGFNLYQETLQPRWIFTTDTLNTCIADNMKNMDSKTRQILRKNERLGIEVRELKYEELFVFKDIMQHTGDRRDFIDRPLTYYQEMYNHLSEDKIIKYLVAELDTKKCNSNYKDEILEIELEMKNREEKYLKLPEKMNKNKFEQKQKESKNNIDRIKNSINHINKLEEQYGDKITLGGILFLVYGDEVLSLVGGSYKDLMEFQSAYTIHWSGIKYAIENNYKRYNFYGITGDFNQNNPLYGLYSFKRDFGGKVVEFFGEFDLIVNKPLFILYNVSFKIYKNLKKIYNKLRK